VVVKFGTDAERAMVDELKLEHTQMSEEIERFDRAISGAAEADSKKLKEIVRPVMWQLLKHAHKEDEYIFPCLKKYPQNT
jgi:hemerythrin superfamily protein